MDIMDEWTMDGSRGGDLYSNPARLRLPILRWSGVVLASAWLALHCLLPVFASYMKKKNEKLAELDDSESSEEKELERSSW